MIHDIFDIRSDVFDAIQFTLRFYCLFKCHKKFCIWYFRANIYISDINILSPTKNVERKDGKLWENKDKWAQLRLYQCKDSQGLCKLQVFRQTENCILQYLSSRVTKSRIIATTEVYLWNILHKVLRNEWMKTDALK